MSAARRDGMAMHFGIAINTADIAGMKQMVESKSVDLTKNLEIVAESWDPISYAIRGLASKPYTCLKVIDTLLELGARLNRASNPIGTNSPLGYVLLSNLFTLEYKQVVLKHLLLRGATLSGNEDLDSFAQHTSSNDLYCNYLYMGAMLQADFDYLGAKHSFPGMLWLIHNGFKPEMEITPSHYQNLQRSLAYIKRQQLWALDEASMDRTSRDILKYFANFLPPAPPENNDLKPASMQAQLDQILSLVTQLRQDNIQLKMDVASLKAELSNHTTARASSTLGFFSPATAAAMAVDPAVSNAASPRR
jgi:hypothetical protein